MRRTLSRLGTGVVAAVLAACGSGGGGGGRQVEGSFFAVGYDAGADPVATGRATWGTAEAGGGVLETSLTENVDGAIAGPLLREFDLDVDGDGVVELQSTANGERILEGRVGEGSDVVIAASARDGDLPGVLTLVRRSEAAATADLAGDYHFGLFTFDGGEGRGTSGSATFDGLGVGSFPPGAVVNVDGTLVVSGFGSAATYSVAASGQVDLLVSATLPFQGALDPTGEVAVLGGVAASTEFPAWMLLVREATSASTATLSGTYGVVALTFDVGGPLILSFVGDVVADGAGGLEIQGTAINVDGTLASSIGPGTATYTVASDGTLVFDVDGDLLRGGVSASGRYAFVGGAVSAGSDPQMLFLVRR